MKLALITGSSGLIGSEAVAYFDAKGWTVHGLDNNMRREFFGPDGDTTWNLTRLRSTTSRFTHHNVDIRNRPVIQDLFRMLTPHLIVHCAAQPSHELASDRPFDDFDTNAGGTLNVLQAARLHAPHAPFVFLSTNKVYGDSPNERPVRELATRFDYANAEDFHGIDESCRVDRCTHSLFGASKLAADVMVQEYGRYFGMPTVCLRGGCLTGPNHSAAELHGFLAYIARAIKQGRRYRILGYKGKQVRDNIHSLDVCRFIDAFQAAPRSGAVYNIGGGRANSISVLEGIERLQDLIGRRLDTEYVDQNRVGDHVCYISDLRRIRADYPGWDVTVSIDSILHSLAGEAAVQNV